MKNQIRQKTISKLTTVIVSILLILGAFSGCGSSNTDSSGDTTGTEEQTSENASEEEENRTGLLLETAKDGRIDFTVLQEENPEIWGWLYIPGTDIDRPLLQSATSDAYYQDHTADGQEGEAGALYIERAFRDYLSDWFQRYHNLMVPFWIMETLNNPGFRWKILDSWTFSAKTAMDQYFLNL